MYSTQFNQTQVNRIKNQIMTNKRKKENVMQFRICLSLLILVVVTLLTCYYQSQSNEGFSTKHQVTYQMYEVLCENGDGELNQYAYTAPQQGSYEFEVEFCNHIDKLNRKHK